MALPSKEAFEDVLDKSQYSFFPSYPDTLSRYQRMRKESKFSKTIDLRYNSRSDVIKVLIDLYYQFISFSETINQHEVHQWFEKQPTYLKAKRSMWSRVKIFEGSPEEWIEEMMLQFEEYKAGGEKNFYSLEDWFEKRMDIFNSLSLGMFFMMARPFYNYYYSDRGEGVYRAKQDFDRVKAQFRQNLDEMIALLEYQEFLEKDGKAYRGKTINNLRELLEVDFYSPVVRLDETIKERMLVYDLDVNFRKRFRHSKANSIYHLLAMEGIEHNLEKRTIERILARRREERRAKYLLRLQAREKSRECDS